MTVDPEVLLRVGVVMMGIGSALAVAALVLQLRSPQEPN
jgi:hypothetical protein